MAQAPSTTKSFGLSAKHFGLGLLTVQSCTLLLLSRRSDTLAGLSHYASTTAALAGLVQLLFCLGLHLKAEAAQGISYPRGLGALPGQLLCGDAWKLSIPAVLYLLQGSLQRLAVGLASVDTFQLAYQLRFLTTAVCAVLLLRIRLPPIRWIALLLLTIGVTLLQWPSTGPGDTGAVADQHAAIMAEVAEAKETAMAASAKRHLGAGETLDASIGEPWSSEMDRNVHTAHDATDNATKYQLERWIIGVAVTFVACIASSLGSVYFERVLKNKPSSIWLRGAQFSLFSFMSALLIDVAFIDGADIRNNGFFYGYTGWAWLTVGLQATGGLLTALVLCHADNLLKGFADGFAIAASGLLSTWLLRVRLDMALLAGTAAVIYAALLYRRREHTDLALVANRMGQIHDSDLGNVGISAPVTKRGLERDIEIGQDVSFASPTAEKPNVQVEASFNGRSDDTRRRGSKVATDASFSKQV